MFSNYQFPLSFSSLITQQDLHKCGLEESVYKFVQLILVTSCSDVVYDAEFGCSFWDYEFHNVMNDSQLKAKIKESVITGIEKYEKRLELKKVVVDINNKEIEDNGQVRSKKELSLRIEGILTQTGEQYYINESFFIGPFSK